MDTQQIKAEVEKNLERLKALRDEVKLKLHLASLDAKAEWDEKLSPRVLEVETTMRRNIADSSSTLKELIAKLEEFVVHLRDPGRKDDTPPHSTH